MTALNPSAHNLLARYGISAEQLCNVNVPSGLAPVRCRTARHIDKIYYPVSDEDRPL